MGKAAIILSLLAVVFLASQAPHRWQTGFGTASCHAAMPGTVLIDDEDPAVLTQAGTANDSWEQITDDSQEAPPGGKALRVHVGQAVDPPYLVQVFSGKTQAPCKRGMWFGQLLAARPGSRGQRNRHDGMRLQMYQAPWDPRWN